MLIAARNALMAGGKRTPTAKDYVQDGLVAMWDGIENAGWGKHVDSTDTWIDIVSGYNLSSRSQVSFTGGYIDGDTNFQFARAGKNDVISEALLTNETITLECITSPITSPASSYSSICSIYAHGLWSYYAGRPYAQCFWQTISSSVSDVAISTVYDNGILRLYQEGIWVDSKTISKTQDYTESNGITIGEGGYRAANCKYYCFRVYNRALTAYEIAAHYAVDKARFGLP